MHVMCMILNQTQCHAAVTTAASAPMPPKESSTKHTVIMIKKRTSHIYMINRKWANYMPSVQKRMQQHL